MSFMYNPYPYDDPQAVNKPVLSAQTVASLTTGTLAAAARLAQEFAAAIEAAPRRNLIVAFDGYTTASWTQLINLLSQQLELRGVDFEAVDFARTYKSEEQINRMLHPYLEWDRAKDPTLLYGRVFKGGYEALLDDRKSEEFERQIAGFKTPAAAGRVIAVYGCGCLVGRFREAYDVKCYLDVTPKESILRIRRGEYANLGDRTARPANRVIRRCYYADFEMAIHLRGELLRGGLLDYYVASDHSEGLQLLPRTALEEMLSALAAYPFRCRPVYLEGVWGGTYVKKLRNLPQSMRNCAWVFDLIPMEVSIVVEAGSEQIEFPFFTFVQREGEAIMGSACVRKFGGYFPIRFNYDDTYHSSGNMSIQVHSGEQYNREHFDELGRQDESYYVVAAGHDARTWVGFRDDADTDRFIREIKLADSEHKPVDYQRYIHYEVSQPGLQVMLPAGTIHSSGRNQVVLEIGSLTIGSYTYKLYDYLREDLDGKPRPIHTWHGERTLAFDRRASWVRSNLVQQPRLVRQGDGWAEYIVGESDLLYFSLRRLEFDKQITDHTQGRFHVLALVDGECVRIRSAEHPERYFDARFMDMVVVPADMGSYVIENLRSEPICIHKTMLRDGFDA